METKRKWTTSLPFRVVSFAAVPVVLLYWAGTVLPYYNGLLDYYATAYSRAMLFGLLALVCAVLLLGFQLVPILRREGEDDIPLWRERCVTVLLCGVILFTFGFLKDSGGHWDFGYPSAPYISQGVLPLLEQMEEEEPDFSVQKPLGDAKSGPSENGWVDVDKSFLRPLFLILCQDGENEEWYHIMYWEFHSQRTATKYAALRLETEPEGARTEAVQNAVYWRTPEGWEVMQEQRGCCVVQVTYAGEKAFRPLVERWSEAIFPG